MFYFHMFTIFYYCKLLLYVYNIYYVCLQCFIMYYLGSWVHEGGFEKALPGKSLFVGKWNRCTFFEIVKWNEEMIAYFICLHYLFI